MTNPHKAELLRSTQFKREKAVLCVRADGTRLVYTRLPHHAAETLVKAWNAGCSEAEADDLAGLRPRRPTLVRSNPSISARADHIPDFTKMVDIGEFNVIGDVSLDDLMPDPA